MSVVFSRYYGFLHQKNWQPRYNWYIIDENDFTDKTAYSNKNNNGFILKSESAYICIMD
jgi:hypothetical protein